MVTFKKYNTYHRNSRVFLHNYYYIIWRFLNRINMWVKRNIFVSWFEVVHEISLYLISIIWLVMPVGFLTSRFNGQNTIYRTYLISKISTLETWSNWTFKLGQLKWEKQTQYQFKVMLSKEKQWHVVLPTISTYKI